MSRKVLVILITILMMFSLSACGVRESLNEKIVEKVSETVVEKATDGAVNMDIKDGQISLKGQDGEEITFGDTKWPEDKAGAQLPKFNKGQVISVVNAEAACVIILEKVEKQDFLAYIDEIKDAGFVNNVVEFTSDTGQVYSAIKDEGEVISLLYDSESKAFHITYEIK